jgi:outer membrane immunogenic protein
MKTYIIQKLVLIILLTLSASVLADNNSDWNGFYGGVNIGYSNMNSQSNYQHVNSHTGDNTYEFGTPSNTNYNAQYKNDNSFAVSGIKLGYVKEVNSLILGLAFDAKLRKDFNQTNDDVIGAYGDFINLKVKERDIFNFKFTAGKSFGNFLPYLAAGIAQARIDTSVTQSTVCCGGIQETKSFSNSKNEFGYLLGFGANYALNGHWFINAEYSYLNFGNAKLDSNNSNPGAYFFPASSSKTEITSNNIQLGINYKF